VAAAQYFARILVFLQVLVPLLLRGPGSLVAEVANLLGARVELAELGEGRIAGADRLLRHLPDVLMLADELVDLFPAVLPLIPPENAEVPCQPERVVEVHSAPDRAFRGHVLLLLKGRDVLQVELSGSARYDLRPL